MQYEKKINLDSISIEREILVIKNLFLKTKSQFIEITNAEYFQILIFKVCLLNK